MLLELGLSGQSSPCMNTCQASLLLRLLVLVNLWRIEEMDMLKVFVDWIPLGKCKNGWTKKEMRWHRFSIDFPKRMFPQYLSLPMAEVVVMAKLKIICKSTFQTKPFYDSSINEVVCEIWEQGSPLLLVICTFCPWLLLCWMDW